MGCTLCNAYKQVCTNQVMKPSVCNEFLYFDSAYLSLKAYILALLIYSFALSELGFAPRITSVCLGLTMMTMLKLYVYLGFGQFCTLDAWSGSRADLDFTVDSFCPLKSPASGNCRQVT
jgi:hypothetical protein